MIKMSTRKYKELLLVSDVLDRLKDIIISEDHCLGLKFAAMNVRDDLKLYNRTSHDYFTPRDLIECVQKMLPDVPTQEQILSIMTNTVSSIETKTSDQDESLSKLSVHELISRLMKVITEQMVKGLLEDDNDLSRTKAAFVTGEIAYILGMLSAMISNDQSYAFNLEKRIKILEKFNQPRWHGYAEMIKEKIND